MTDDPRAALRDLAGDYTHLHDRCRRREAALAGLLAEARDLIDRHLHAPEAPQNSDFTDLLRRIDAATTDNAREGR